MDMWFANAGPKSTVFFFEKFVAFMEEKTMKPGHMNLHAFVDRWCLSPFVVVMR